MRRTLSLLLASLGTAHAAPSRRWLPWESWLGGKQYDARLDRPVTLWVTGMPLAQVFAAIEQQTNVRIGFLSGEGPILWGRQRPRCGPHQVLPN